MISVTPVISPRSMVHMTAPRHHHSITPSSDSKGNCPLKKERGRAYKSPLPIHTRYERLVTHCECDILGRRVHLRGQIRKVNDRSYREERLSNLLQIFEKNITENTTEYLRYQIDDTLSNRRDGVAI